MVLGLGTDIVEIGRVEKRSDVSRSLRVPSPAESAPTVMGAVRGVQHRMQRVGRGRKPC